MINWCVVEGICCGNITRGLYYNASKQEISGFQDLGHLGKSNIHANHALVFMVRGIHKSWKQVVAYYFTHNSVSSITLKSLITYVIKQLQEIGLKVVHIVCDQGETNQGALKELCCEKSTEAFLLDQQKMFKTSPKLRRNHFELITKIKVKVAAAQVSHTVAAVIETYVAFNILPAEAIYTAEFVEKMDCLFDSLNSSYCYPQDENGFNFLSMRAFNQDPVENVFCCVRQHGVANTNPTCFQFKAALKTVIANNMSLPTKSLGNCEDDRCMPLSNLRQFLGASDDNFLDSTTDHSIIDRSALYCALADNEASAGSGGADVRNDRQALAYVAGYILRKMGVTFETNSSGCKTTLFSPTPTEHHLFTSFKEYDALNPKLLYSSDSLMSFVANVHTSQAQGPQADPSMEKLMNELARLNARLKKYANNNGVRGKNNQRR
ncbi:uncharacterized protein LOC126456407 [Schistocerca serialis cubense]|uniref:uncharacterized protein LOC126456407 n=1 Tax=Schistocerca serialis cubense TaxID=2023355 RepID=UPI00214E6762|nr:uncharacterized protein LOC126456407 [Schistocerca serialis cubense]